MELNKYYNMDITSLQKVKRLTFRGILMRLFSMRRRLMFIFALAVALPLIVSGYILIHRAEQALNLEKESKLYRYSTGIGRKHGRGF